MRTWETSLFGCLEGKDVGVACCVQNCVCQPCVWGDALKRSGVQRATLYLPPLLSLSRVGPILLIDTAGYRTRRRLMHRYGIVEPDAYSLLVSCCCCGCARFQELNTMMVREGYAYDCASVSSPTPPHLVSAPPVVIQAVMERGTGCHV